MSLSAQPVDLDALRAQVDAEIAARRAAEAAAGLLVSRMSFRVGGVCLLLPSDVTTELAEMPQIYRLPGAPTGIMGLANRHGRMVPVVDLATLLNTNATIRQHWLLVFGRDESAAGMLVDRIPERRRFPADSTVPLTETTNPGARFGIAVYRDAEGDWVDLDATALMDAVSSNQFAQTSL